MKWIKNNQSDEANVYLNENYNSTEKDPIRDYDIQRKDNQNKAYNDDPDIRNVYVDQINNTAWDLYLSLVTRHKDTASQLAKCFRHGYGVAVNAKFSNLALSIGVALGDSDAIKMQKELKIKFSNKIKQLSDKIALAILINANQIGDNYTCGDALAYAKAVDSIVKKSLNTGFLDQLYSDVSGIGRYAVSVELESPADPYNGEIELTGNASCTLL